MENFRGKQDFLKGGPKFPNGISERKLCVPFALSDQFQAFRIGSLATQLAFPLKQQTWLLLVPGSTLQNPATVNGTANPVWKFPFGF